MSYYNTDEQPIEQSEEVEPPPIPKRKLKPRKQSEMEELAADESIREPVAVSPIKEKTSSPSKSKKVPAEHLLEPAKEFSILVSHLLYCHYRQAASESSADAN